MSSHRSQAGLPKQRQGDLAGPQGATQGAAGATGARAVRLRGVAAVLATVLAAVLGGGVAAGAGGCRAGCKGARRSGSRASASHLQVRVVGSEWTPEGCQWIVRLRARRSLRTAAVRLAGGGPSAPVGPMLSGEIRFVALRGPQGGGTSGRGACPASAPRVEARGVPGPVPPRWSGLFGLLDWKPFVLRASGEARRPERDKRLEGEKSPRGPERCLIAFALRVRRAGRLGPVLTVFDAQGRALALRDRLACGGEMASTGVLVYCSAQVGASCGAVRRVVVSRGAPVRRGRLEQVRLRIAECNSEGPGRARLDVTGPQVPSWASGRGTVAYLLDLRGAVTAVAFHVARLDAYRVRVRSPSLQPCVEASLVLLQHVASASSRRGRGAAHRRGDPQRPSGGS